MSVTLPDTPSKLIELALQDLKSVEQDSGYEIDMEQWYVKQESGLCVVCLAGAVMSQRFTDVEHGGILHPSEWEGQSGKLYALNWLRKGYIHLAYDALGRDMPEALPWFKHVKPYHLNKDRFYQDMESLVALLKEYGE